MNAIFLVGFVALATFPLCEGTTPSINVQGLDIDTIRDVGKGQAINIFGSPSSSNNGHLLGDMQFVDNQIVIQEPGLYFFYATLRVHGYDQRFSLTINSKDVFYGIPVGSGGTSISGTYCVKQGDKIGLKAYDNVSIWVSNTHDNLGAFKIIATETCGGSKIMATKYNQK